jgi:hypothetical protein
MYAFQILDNEEALLASLQIEKMSKSVELSLGAHNNEYKILKHTLKPEKNKKIISFSVYGDKEIYIAGAEYNIEEALKNYPDWICRFYCAENVPNLDKLLNNDLCEVLVLESKIFPMYWRFFAIDDPLVDVVCVRDSDSSVNKKEYLAVEEWLKGNKRFHTMHDADSPRAHAKIVMGGMWGIKCKDKTSFTNLIDLYSSSFNYEWWYGQDQEFLEQQIFPLFKNNCIDHSSHTVIRWDHSVPFPEGGDTGLGAFVGDRINPVQSKQVDLSLFSLDSNKIFLFCHQAFDDFLACNGLVRHLSEKHKELILPIKKENLSAVSYMFRDLENLKFVSIEDDNNAFNIYLDSYKESHRFIGLGFWGKDPSKFDVSNPEESFYTQLGLNTEDMISKFYVDLSDVSKEHLEEEELNKILKFKEELA